MADAYIQVLPSSDVSAVKVDNTSLTVGANTAYRQRIIIADDSTAAALGKVMNSTPGGSEYGLVVRQAGTATVSITGTPTVTISGTPTVTVSGTVTTTPSTSTTGTVTSVAGSATSVTLLASNSSRKGGLIFNQSTANLYVKFAATATTTSFSYWLAPNGLGDIPASYTGVIDGVWDSATGNARITEFT